MTKPEEVIGKERYEKGGAGGSAFDLTVKGWKVY